MKFAMWQMRATSRIRSSEMPGLPIVMFSRIVPLFSQVSCKTMPKPPRSEARVRSRRSVPSRVMLPPVTS